MPLSLLENYYIMNSPLERLYGTEETRGTESACVFLQNPCFDIISPLNEVSISKKITAVSKDWFEARSEVLMILLGLGKGLRKKSTFHG